MGYFLYRIPQGIGVFLIFPNHDSLESIFCELQESVKAVEPDFVPITI